MDNLDVKRIQQEAFSTIDNLFSDGESKDENIIKLKEKILTLDWEFNPNDIQEIINILNTLKNKYTDKVNSVLISMMINISKFLLVAKEKSPSDTLNVLAYIIDFFARLNEGQEISVEEKKKYIAEIKSKYIKIKDAFTKLQPDSHEKQKAPEVEDKNKEQVVSEQESIIKSETESLSQEKQIEKQEVFVIEDEERQEKIRESLDDVSKESIKVENIDLF